MQANSSIPCTKPGPRHWMNHFIGRTEVHLASIASLRDSESGAKSPEIRVELAVDGQNAKEDFKALREVREQQIEKALGFPVVWHNPEDKNMCRIYVRCSGDWLHSERWPELHQWLKEKLEAFDRVFTPLVKALRRR